MAIIHHHIAEDLRYSHSISEHPDADDFSMHAHGNYELYLFIRGNGSYLVEGNQYPLTPGCVLLVRPAETHCLMINSSEPYERITVNFNRSAIMAVDPTLHTLAPFDERPLGQLNLYTTADIGSDIVSQCLKNVPFENNPNLRLSIICSLMMALDQIGNAFRRGKGLQPPTSKNRMATEIVDYINRNLFNQLSLTRICDQFYISKAQLNRVFRAATGSSVWDYITIKRLIAAREIIRSGRSASDAAREVGFSDYSTFYRAYRLHFDRAPKNDVQ